MASLAPCPRCSRHVRASETSCPFCSTALDARPEPACVEVPSTWFAGRAEIMSFRQRTGVAAVAALLATGCCATSVPPYGTPPFDAGPPRDAGVAADASDAARRRVD